MPSNFDQKPQIQGGKITPIEANKLGTPNPQPQGVKEAEKQKFDAAAQIATGADKTVAKVLNRARRMADDQLDPQIEQLASKLAPRMVSNELQQAEAIVSFFIEEWGDTSRVLKPYVEVLDAEVLTP
jgi:hypothetical protein